MTKDIFIRLATTDDAKQILEIYGPIVEYTAISFESQIPTETEMSLRIEKVMRQFPWLVAVAPDSKILGYAYASAHRERAAYRWATDVAANVREGCRGSGIGFELYAKLFEMLKKQNYFRAFAGIALPNEASVSLHEKAGFKNLGTFKNVGFKFGKWHDAGWWELTLKESSRNPPEPIPLNELI